tara:strand:+ start:21 stop:299 length:279 start_codon:yes stop_codon:yes gene_type:complete
MRYGKKSEKFKEGGKLTMTNKSVKVDAPEGYHWMEESGRFYLMEGKYQPHDGAVEKAKFKVVTHPKKGMLGMVVGPMMDMAKKTIGGAAKSM